MKLYKNTKVKNINDLAMHRIKDSKLQINK